jgi:cysteinyl-tRNA synthetase
LKLAGDAEAADASSQSVKGRAAPPRGPMPLALRDSLSGETRPVRRRPRRPVALYVCGPTVYAPAHVGHARNYLEFDLVRRNLEADGRRVRHVMNLTDVEDKIDQRAAELGVTWRALARREEASFFRDMDALRVLRPHERPRASEFVGAMIDVARRLERTGRVRHEGDAWIYRPPERPRGANFSSADAIAQHAVPEPTHPFPRDGAGAGEFVLWKLQSAPRAAWPSPWGEGVPGWHLECYAMARHYLGIPVDVHGGGRDLMFPHHFAENEIALALDRNRFSRLFVHVAFVLQAGSKMAKSTGNLVTIRSALEDGSPDALRFYLLDRPYSERIEWSASDYAAAARAFARVRAAFRTWTRPGAGGRYGARAAAALLAGVRRDLLGNLESGRAVARLREFADRLGADATARAPRGELSAVRAAVSEIERRTGLTLR